MENITVIGTIEKKKTKKLETGKTEKGSELAHLGPAKSDQLGEDLGDESEEMELEREAGTKS